MATQNVVELQGRNYLRRLGVFLDVVYALLFVQMLQYLPQAEDMSWRDRPLGLLQVLIDNGTELLRIVVGCGLTLIYWNLSNRLLGSLVRTDIDQFLGQAAVSVPPQCLRGHPRAVDAQPNMIGAANINRPIT